MVHNHDSGLPPYETPPLYPEYVPVHVILYPNVSTYATHTFKYKFTENISSFSFRLRLWPEDTWLAKAIRLPLTGDNSDVLTAARNAFPFNGKIHHGFG